MNIDHAIEIFLHGLLGVTNAENQSERRIAGDLPVIHFDDSWDDVRRIGDEFVVSAHAPAAALAAMAAYGPEPDHLITLIGRPPSDYAAYVAAGYRQTETEALMAREVAPLPPLDSRYDVVRIRDSAQLRDQKPVGKTWTTAAKLHEPRLRHSMIVLDGRPVARARVCHVDPDCGYVSHVYTAPDYRRRGLAQALMAQILHDAAAEGEQWSVLVSSEAGLPLYQALGYQHLADLAVFKPAPAEERAG
ncbi:MAG TPA: GNAT family N-acetyltransferase [Herpetosiphonaceae bacterium]